MEEKEDSRRRDNRHELNVLFFKFVTLALYLCLCYYIVYERNSVAPENKDYVFVFLFFGYIIFLKDHFSLEILWKKGLSVFSGHPTKKARKAINSQYLDANYSQYISSAKNDNIVNLSRSNINQDNRETQDSVENDSERDSL